MATQLYIVRHDGDDYEIRAISAEHAVERFIRTEGTTTRSTVFWTVDVARAPRKRDGYRPEPDYGDWESQSVAQQPDEPACKGRKKHDWQHGQVFGSGGGVAYTDTCCRCGLQRQVDTWATNPENNTQGHYYREYL